MTYPSQKALSRETVGCMVNVENQRFGYSGFFKVINFCRTTFNA